MSQYTIYRSRVHVVGYSPLRKQDIQFIHTQIAHIQLSVLARAVNSFYNHYLRVSFFCDRENVPQIINTCVGMNKDTLQFVSVIVGATSSTSTLFCLFNTNKTINLFLTSRLSI